MIWPSCPRTLLEHALFHDVGEVQTGDVPFPVKAQNAELKRIMTEMEFDAHRTMALDWGIPEPAHLPNADEKRVFKLCEFLEMWEWGLAEREMGNRRATLVVTRCIEQVWRLTEELERDENLAPIVERCRVLIRKRSLTHEATMEDGQYEC
jgi:5'-deoxynucleotidase YfbR-like HD superfamily hydrolase